MICCLIFSSTASLRSLSKSVVCRTTSAPVTQAFFSTEAKAKPSNDEIKKKVKEAATRVKEDREKDAIIGKAATTEPVVEATIVKTEECFTTVKSADGIETTIQTKPVDSKGQQPIEEKVVQLAEQVLSLNFVQVAQLLRIMKERLGLPDVMAAPAAGSVSVSAAGSATPEVEKKEEKKEKKAANVKLMKYDAKDKIKIIKEVRGILGLGLKESKALVESVPVILKENMPIKEAEALVAKLKEMGAELTME